jgi:hypothetical protein
MVITSKKKEIVNANIISIEAGTNCPKGGDSGHGGRTYFRLEDRGSTAWKINIIKAGQKISFEQPSAIEIVLAGDTENETFLESLKFAIEVLERQVKEHREQIEFAVKEVD